MTMVDSTGTTILSETQALSGSVKQKYSTPDPTIVYGDNDLLTLTGLIKGHTYTINESDYIADENGVVTLPSSLISDTAATQLSITDKSLISATSSAPASKETTVATSKYKQPTPAPEINYDTGSFTNLIPNASYIIDGKTYTADGKGNLTIDVPLYGKTFSFIKAHVNSDGSDEDSAAVSVTVAAIPDAPSASDYPVTEAASSDEKATVSVPSGSEYKDPTTGEWVKGPADVKVTPGTSLTVRVSATSTAPASKETSIPTKIYQEPTPEGTANYTDGKLTGFVPNATYTINGTTYTADADGNIPLDENWYGTSLSVVRVHVNSDGSDADSTPETINVSSRPAAPTNEEVKATQESDGTESITVSETQEYSVDGGVTWIKGENNTVSVSGDKKVMVRTAATANAPAGEITTISVDPFYPYKTPAAIASYAGGFLLLLAIIYRSIIYFAWHNKDKHNHLGFFVANNRWINVLLFHTPYNKVELQAQEDAKQAEEDKKEGK
jgi:hypothetical protein